MSLKNISLIRLSLRRLPSALAATLFCVAFSAAQSSTLQGAFQVSAQVGGSACTTIAAGPLSFGTTSQTGQATATSAVSVSCSAGTAYSIAANGSNPVACAGTSTGTQSVQEFYAMGTVTQATSVPVYGLFADSAMTKPLATGGTNPCATGGTGTLSPLTGTGTGAVQSLTIYGALVASAFSTATTPAGSYSDTATITLTF